MGNLLDHLIEYQDKTFEQHPFNLMDALLMCQLAYLKYNGIVPADSFVEWDEVVRHDDSEAMYKDRLFGELYREVMTHVASGRRYAETKIGFFREEVSIKKECQFAATTFKMPGNRYFASFRGTDEKIVGWKEDFNMSYMDEVPSQALALEYIKTIPSDGPLFLGGHSKGGSEAVYAAAKAPRHLQERISGVYSFDGVGLGDEMYASEGYRRISSLITKIIPDESVVGTLFERPENCLIIESDAHGIKQHDFMNWKIRDGHFIYREKLKPAAARLANRLRHWMDSMDDEQRHEIVDLIYDMVLACRPKDIYNMADEIPMRIKTVIGSIINMPRKDRDEIKSALRKLL